MNIDRLFLTVHARDHQRLVDWWTILLGRPPARSPVPSCREWDIGDGTLFQVIQDAGAQARATFSDRIVGLGAEVERLRRGGIAVPDPTNVPGFEALLWTRFFDPEGNEVNILEGA